MLPHHYLLQIIVMFVNLIYITLYFLIGFSPPLGNSSKDAIAPLIKVIFATPSLLIKVRDILYDCIASIASVGS